METEKLVEMQRKFFNTGSTRSVGFRKAMLQRLYNAIKDNEWRIANAMKEDMNKSEFEVYMTETGLVLDEIRFHLNHLSAWTKEKRVLTPLAQFSAKSFVSPEPYGITLIMSPWNYPVQLCLEPLVGAISAGCTAVIKPSAYAPATSHAIAKIIHSVFPPKYIAVVEGGREENKALLDQKFDYIFFTGSKAVGRLVMESASKHLTPLTLELGGKSPVIVDETANIRLAAKRIAFGKVLNAGQTCVEPDYMFIHSSVKENFILAYQDALDEFFPDGDMSDMNVIINDKHFQRANRLLGSGRAVIGGGSDPERRFIEPTLLDDVSLDSPIMQEEIFAPILPMITYDDIDECIDYIVGHEKPLALYVFSTSHRNAKHIIDSCSFGGGCINDTIIHLATSRMGFGGVGESGMGSYHGKKSFDTFTHYRSIVKKDNWIDLPVRYRPYTALHEQIIRFLIH